MSSGNKLECKVETTTTTTYELKLDGKQIIALLNGQLTIDHPISADAGVVFAVPGGESGGLEVDVDKHYPIIIRWEKTTTTNDGL